MPRAPQPGGRPEPRGFPPVDPAPRPAGLKLWLLAGLVLLAHALALEWFARQADAPSALTRMVAPMYTRTLRPTQAPVVVAAAAAPAVPPPRPRAHAPRPRPPASAPQQEPNPPAPAPEPAPEAPAAAAGEPAAPEPPAPESTAVAAAPAASAPAVEPAQAVASAAAAAAADAAAIDRWPADSRLTYRLSGKYVLPLNGDARVQWQREGSNYQVKLEVDVKVVSQTFTSQGQVTPQGLLPRIYEEANNKKRRLATFGDEVVQLDNGSTVPRPPGVQDTASQFVELSQRFATGKDLLQVGRTVTVWLARPGGVDQWTYDIVEREILRTPRFGPVEAFHLKPRPLANPKGNITAEMWFAPSLQYLPVKIKVLWGNDGYVDLLVDQIEQR
jgi:hypothetical protein